MRHILQYAQSICKYCYVYVYVLCNCTFMNLALQNVREVFYLCFTKLQMQKTTQDQGPYFLPLFFLSFLSSCSRALSSSLWSRLKVLACIQVECFHHNQQEERVSQSGGIILFTVFVPFVSFERSYLVPCLACYSYTRGKSLLELWVTTFLPY